MTRAIELEPAANSTDRNLAVGILHPTHLESRAHSNLTKKGIQKLKQCPKSREE
jgi:hypothetical protein